ncbi:filamentous hemagglutinin N-terminal domain-containing protein, partial [Variovorax sp. N23]|nr:filamentous hemagglutinin N-terminal domain-containing protein [Variovorax sp. N23]
PRTEVIIANPAGIQVDGGGFINVNRATLTTGTPQFNAQGGLDSFVVRGGTVSIDGAGLDASKTDYAAILARAVQVNAGIWANELKVVTGANQVSADSSQASPTAGNGAAPSFALDVAALGGMYAGKITLVGTEAGVGVRNAGHIGAGAGGLVVTAAGRLENTGTLEGAKVELRSASDIDNRGGTIRQAGTREISVTAPVLSNTNGGVIGAEPVAATDAASGTPSTGTGATGTGTTPTTSTTAGTTTTAGITEATPLQPAAATGSGAIAATGSVLNDGGHIYAGGEIALNTPRIDNTGGSLSVGTMAVTGDRFSNAGGTLNVGHDFSANVGKRRECRRRGHHERCRPDCSDWQKRGRSYRSPEPGHGQCSKLGATAGRGGDAEGGASATDH